MVTFVRDPTRPQSWYTRAVAKPALHLSLRTAEGSEAIPTCARGDRFVATLLAMIVSNDNRTPVSAH
jgi:hypothetical protein